MHPNRGLGKIVSPSLLVLFWFAAIPAHADPRPLTISPANPVLIRGLTGAQPAAAFEAIIDRQFAARLVGADPRVRPVLASAEENKK